MFEDIGANDITVEDIESFLNDDGVATPATETEESSPATQPDPQQKVPITETQSFARRLKEETTKIREKERESIAKSLGYENYAELLKYREDEMLREKGLDPTDVSSVVEELVERRLADDPRIKELDEFRKEKMNAWAQKELTELNEFTGGKISKMSDVPNDVIELWKTKGSLKAAYLELHGEQLIREMRAGIASNQNRGSTSHLNSPQGSPNQRQEERRPLTQQERDIYKLFNPDVTDEELSKMYKNK